MSTNMSAKKKLALMEFVGSIITIGLIILNTSLIFGSIMCSVMGEAGIAKAIIILLILSPILIVPLGSFVMSAGLKWPETSTLIIFFYVSFSPLLAFVGGAFIRQFRLELFIGLTAVVLICHILIRRTISFCTKRGKAYRQKLLDEIAAEEAVAPPQNS